MTTATCTTLVDQFLRKHEPEYQFVTERQQHHGVATTTLLGVSLRGPSAATEEAAHHHQPHSGAVKTSGAAFLPLGELPPTAPPTPSCPDTPLSLGGGEVVPPRLTPRKKKAPGALPPPPPFLPVHEGSVIENFRQALEEIDLEDCDDNGENAFYVCDLAEVYRQARRWHRVLGDRVEPFFAVKCNPDPHVLRLLAAFGTGFDCASQAEISLVLSMGVDPSRIIYANPCKAASFIRHAASHDVRMMTFDNFDELDKVARFHPRARMVLRILTDDTGSLCRFGDKFGAPVAEARPLLERAKQLGLEVIGVSFHVGSGCTNPDLYRDAIGRAKQVFEVAAEVGYEFDLLDVGGGFGDENFEKLAGGLVRGLDEFFPLGCGVRVIAEPGRYFVTQAFELATNIIARRAVNESELAVREQQDVMDDAPSPNERPLTLYYVNDGLYGAFNAILFEARKGLQPEILTSNGAWSPTTDLFVRAKSASPLIAASAGQECKIFGPTCDSIDLVCPVARLPCGTVQVGDWLRWTEMGAYTICAASQFNGFRQSEVRYCVDARGEAGVEEEVRALLGL